MFDRDFYALTECLSESVGYIPPRGELSSAEICSHCEFFISGRCIRNCDECFGAESHCASFRWLKCDEISPWSPFPCPVDVAPSRKIISILARDFPRQAVQTFRERVNEASKVIKKGMSL